MRARYSVCAVAHVIVGKSRGKERKEGKGGGEGARDARCREESTDLRYRGITGGREAEEEEEEGDNDEGEGGRTGWRCG